MLVFGPQTFNTPEQWNSVFSVLPTKPYFLTLWYESAEAGANANGEYAWIFQDQNPYVEHHLANFYKNSVSYQTKMGAVAPGFKDYYTEGGWAGPDFTINHNGLSTFQKSLDLALQQNIQHIQLATWNDYGEGTMIEPTREFGYGFLTTLQQKLGVQYRQPELELVYKLFEQRRQYAGNAQEQTRLNQVFYYLASLQIGEARDLLNKTSSGNKPIRIEAENYAVMHGVATQDSSEGGKNVGWIDAGDWMVWNVNVPASGTYKVEYRIASIHSTGMIRLEGSYGKPVYGSLKVPNTGGWQNWQTISHTVTLNAGQQELAINAPSGGYNINWLQLTKLN